MVDAAKGAQRSAVRDKSFAFAVRVANAHKHISATHREYVLSKQMLRSGTAIGALVREAEQAESRRDFLHKLRVALKEATETEYWLLLLRETGFLTPHEFTSVHRDLLELLRLLTSIINTTRLKQIDN
jgi:four helix bundle protein